MPVHRQLNWRTARKGFRYFRIGLLALCALAAAGVLWLNIFGFPQWLTTRVEAQLSQKNLHIEIKRIRLRGFNDFVATGMRIQAPVESGVAAEITVPNAELVLEPIRGFDFKVRGLRIENGRIDLPVHYPSAPPRFLVVSNITTELRFLPGDVWNFSQLSASTLGMRAHASASLTNVSAVIAKNRTQQFGGSKGDWRKPVNDLIRVLQELEFSSSPDLALTITGNGVDPHSFELQLRLRAANARADRLALKQLHLLSSVRPDPDRNVNGAFLLEISDVQWSGGHVREAAIRGETEWAPGMQRLITNHVAFRASGIKTRWMETESAEAILSSEQPSASVPIVTRSIIHSTPLNLPHTVTGSNLITGTVSHSLPFPTPSLLLGRFLPFTNSMPVSASSNFVAADWALKTSHLSIGKAHSHEVTLSGRLESRDALGFNPTESRPWDILAPFHIPWRFALSNITTEGVQIGSLSASGEWKAPRFEVESIEARLYGGDLTATTALDLDQRLATGSIRGEFDYRRVAAALLGGDATNWLSDIGWQHPPLVESTFLLQLPDWNSEWTAPSLAAGLVAQGRIESAPTFRGLDFESIRSSISISNTVVILPDLRISRRDGVAQVSYHGSLTNLDFNLQLQSSLNPGFLRPLFPEADQAFRMVRFSEAPLLEGEAAGNWRDFPSLQFRGKLAVTNLFVRGEPIPFVQTDLQYSNLVIECREVLARRGPEEVRVPYLRVDIPKEIMFVTNAVSTMNPWWAMSLVGEDTYDAIDPYRFADVPLVKINGIVPLRRWKTADLHFNVAGTNFSYWRFNLPKLTGDVFWKADNISFSNVVAAFYGGSATWSGHFHINDEKSADFSFQSSFKNANLKPLVADLFSGTNQMQGTLNGQLVITSANSDDFRTWDGYGSATLTEGFLWNVPVFGVFSPVIDALVPGESLSGVTAAEGTFSITNSVVHTSDLQVRAPAFRLNYTGQVDLDGNLNAVVEAEILRDAWFFGKVVSTVLWPVSKAFEARVGGTVSQPTTTLRHFPKFMLAPLKVFGTLKDAVTGKPAAPPPRAPQENPPE